MPDQTVEQQLAEALAENTRLAAKNEELAAFLPPDLNDAGLVYRAGRCQPTNVYVHVVGDPDGYLLGKMPTPEAAAHVIRALNAAQFGSGTAAAELVVKAAALREFSKRILGRPVDLLLRSSILAELALDAAADYEFEARELTEAAEVDEVDEAQSDPPTGRMVLDVPMQANDAEALTIRAYLVELIKAAFEIRKPFGNSGWQHELCEALAKAGLIAAKFDDDGYLDECDDQARARLIAAAIAELAVAR